jgi:ABC-2 type transport system ATP-binding protein
MDPTDVSAAEPPTGAPGVRVEVRGLTKHFGSFAAVDDLSFAVLPGQVTGFLGPNGAGKTTTLRMLLGLVRPSGGEALIDGRPYADLTDPLGTVGAALEATSFHPGRSGRDHLRVLASTAGIPDSRVDELLELTGIAPFAGRRAGAYSLGMRQRLGLASALLGDPQVLLLDEPANGLDPEGIRWLRGFLRHLSGQGKTILVSSHLLQEVEHTADQVIIIHRGRLVAHGSIGDLAGARNTVARTPEPRPLLAALAERHVPARVEADGAVVVETPDLRLVGELAHAAGVPLWELSASRSDLEQIFFQMTTDQLDGGGGPGGRQAPPPPHAPAPEGRVS